MKKFGVLIHPEELDDIWVIEIIKNKVDMVGLHPVGGPSDSTYNSLKRLLDLRNEKDFMRRIHQLQSCNVEIEYAFHGMSYLMPHALFDKYPEWFRMNENGERVADVNFCPSNTHALEYLENASYDLAKSLHPKNHRYHIWQDDVPNGKCLCPACKQLSRADQALIINNIILKGLKRHDPDAMQSHLSYYDTLCIPEQVLPDEGIYLEFAPYKRDHEKPLSDVNSEINAMNIAPIDELIQYFGAKNSTALDYWIDNSLFSSYKKPPRKFTLNEKVIADDISFYVQKDFDYITVFACFLGQDYREIHGMPPLKDCMEIVHSTIAKANSCR